MGEKQLGTFSKKTVVERVWRVAAEVGFRVPDSGFSNLCPFCSFCLFRPCCLCFFLTPDPKTSPQIPKFPQAFADFFAFLVGKFEIGQVFTRGSITNLNRVLAHKIIGEESG